MTPVVTNPIIVTNNGSSNRRDSYYYRDLMHKYEIDEQYSKIKADKKKAKALYEYSEKRYKEERRNETVEGVIVLVFIVIIVIALIGAFI